MSFQFGDGFDCYATTADALNGYWDSAASTTVTNIVVGSAVARFAGSQSIRFGANSSTTLVKTSAVNDALHHLTLAFNQTAAITGTLSGLCLTLFDGATAQCTVVFRSDGAMLLQAGAPGGATLATYTGAFPVASTWYAFEIEVLISNTGGYMNVRKNGNTSNDFTSATNLDTQASANAYANKLQLLYNTNNNYQYVDDLYWRSDASSVAWMGDIRCYTRAPASDASVQFSRTPTGVLTQTAPTPISATTGPSSVTAAFFTPFTAGYSGTVTATAVAVSTVGNAVNMKCAIYADNGSGAPGVVLASATAPVTPVVAGTNTFTFTGVAVTKGVQYWVSFCSDGTNSIYPSTTSLLPNAMCNTAYAVFPQTNPLATTSRYAQMMWTFTATPANWQAVAEAQQDATTSYVYDSVVGHSDLYGIAPIASTPLTTFAVTTRAYAIKSDAGTRTMAVQLKSGASTVASPTVVLTPSNWQWAWRHDTLDPQTGSAWTAAAVNVAQVGPVVIA